MPKAFDACARAGGRIRTKNLSGNRYIKICARGTGKSVGGYVRKMKPATVRAHLRMRK